MSNTHLLNGVWCWSVLPSLANDWWEWERVTHIRVTRLIHMCDITPLFVWHDSFICVTWLIHVWKKSLLGGVWCWSVLLSLADDCWECERVMHIRVTWLIRMCAMTHSYVRHDSFVCVPWRIHTCDMTHSYVWHDSFICATWLIHMCDMNHSYVFCNSFICVPWLIHMCSVTRSYVCHDSFVCVTWLIHTCDMTHPYVWHDSFL